jgi:hypothetical protein
MTLPQRFLHSTLVLAIAGFSASSAFAAQIAISDSQGWNLSNVDQDATATVLEESITVSKIYDRAPAENGATSNGYISYDPSTASGEAEYTPAPGLTAINGASSCIIATGATCDGEFQSGKRFKLDQTNAGSIDLVFDLEPLSDGNNGIYKVFQKYGNNTGSALGGFSIGLGFGIGDAFELSVDGDGLNFKDFGAEPQPNQFSSFFSQGLFGEADSDRDRPEGYFSSERSGFGLTSVSENENLFETTGLFGSYGELFGDWLSYSDTPDGYFFDDDGNPDTDAVLMAHFADGEWKMNRGIGIDGKIETLASGNDGEGYADVAAVEAELRRQAGLVTGGLTLASCVADPSIPCLAGPDKIEDLAKFNVTDFIELFDFNSANQNSFTMRISAYTAAVPEPGTLALFATGLGVMLVRRRTNQRKGMTA